MAVLIMGPHEDHEEAWSSNTTLSYTEFKKRIEIFMRQNDVKKEDVILENTISGITVYGRE